MNVNKEHALKSNCVGMEMISHIYDYALLSYFNSVSTTLSPQRAPEYLVGLTKFPRKNILYF